MSCRRVRLWIERSVDDRLPIEDQFRLEEHVRVCASCRREYALAVALDDALLRLPDPPVDKLDLEASARAIRAGIAEGAIEHPRVPGARPVLVRRATLAGAAAAIASAAALIVVLQRGQGGPERVLVPDGTTEQVAPPMELADLRDPELPAAAASTSDAEQADELFSPERRASVRTELRALLAAAMLPLDQAADPAIVEERASTFDASAAAYVREGWSVPRMMEGLLPGESDTEVARALVRYLGVRGEMLSAPYLESALRKPALAPDAVLALSALGSAGIRGLAAALEEPRLQERAFDALVAVGNEQSAAVLEEAARKFFRQGTARPVVAPAGPGVTTGPLTSCLDALARIGDPAVLPLLRLAKDGVPDRDTALDALERNPDAPRRVAELGSARAPQHTIPAPVLLVAIGRVGAGDALPWVVEQCRAREARTEALACLTSLDGPEPVRALLELCVSSVVERDLAADHSRAMFEGDAERLRLVAEELVASGDRLRAEAFLELLIASGRVEASRALLALAGSELLLQADRAFALLAVGELQAADGAEDLAEIFAALGPRQEQAGAACLISLFSLAGEEAVRTALEPRLEGMPRALSARTARSVLEIVTGKDGSATHDAPTRTLFELASELDPLFTQKQNESWKSAL